MAEYFDEFDDVDNEKSKSEVKRELLALKDLGRDLIALPVKDLNKLSLPENIYETVIKAHSQTHGALKRLVGYLGGLIANADYQDIRQQLEKLQQVHHGEVKQFHQLEQWRDQLLANDEQVMTVLRNTFDNIDSQHIRQLVRNANKEATTNKPPKSARLLFKYLQQLHAES